MYLWFTLFPGNADPYALKIFGPEQVQRGRAYSIIPRITYILSFLVQVSLLGGFVFSGKIREFSREVLRVTGGREWVSYLVVFLGIWFLLRLLTFPFTFYNDFYWQHHWELSSQSLNSWMRDYLKSSLLDLGLSGLGAFLLFWLFKRWPRNWWLMGSIFFSGWLLIQSLLWPVLVAPLFNHFDRVQDSQIVFMVRDLAKNSGLTLNQILVMDASQRTTRANAYFTGVGGTQRIVLYDTLLQQYDLEEIRAVIAHEMAHWKLRHIVQGLLLGIVGGLILWKLVYIALNSLFLVHRYPVEAWPAFLLLLLMIGFLSNPLQNYFSRQMETQADQLAVLFTKDVSAAVRLQIDLATRNLSDLSPPPFITWFGYTHPPALTRIETIKEQSQK